ncbi:MAG: MATE family efflux transporter [Oscillospiraceae bacterium]|nr:MATE family efflux transporter [Oscillospiraceae bacterium]
MDAIEKRPLMFTNKALVTMTIPIILDALLAIVAGMVDSAMVSSAGEAAVSAVSLVDSVNLLFISAFSGMAVGGSVVTSQYVGKRDYRHASVSANQLLYLSTAVALVFMTLLLCAREGVLRLVYGNIDADVFQNASTYFLFTLLGYPFFAMGASSAAVLRSMGKNRQAVTITVLYNILNVIGNAVLIYGFHLGVAGAAISTTVSRMVYAAVGMWLAHNKALPAHFEGLLKFRLDMDVIRRVFKTGVTNGMEGSMFHIGKILLSSLVASFGTVTIAANSVANTLNNVGWVIVGGFGTVLLPVVGQCIGAGEEAQAKTNAKKLFTAATVATYLLFGGVFLLRHQLVRLFDFNQEALQVCAYYTGVYAVLSMGSVYSFSFVPIQAFRAAGDIRYTTVLGLASMFGFRVALSYILNAIFPQLGLMSVCIGMWADWMFRSVMNVIHFLSGKWVRKRLV